MWLNILGTIMLVPLAGFAMAAGNSLTTRIGAICAALIVLAAIWNQH